jgi:hypothetical protein
MDPFEIGARAVVAYPSAMVHAAGRIGGRISRPVSANNPDRQRPVQILRGRGRQIPFSQNGGISKKMTGTVKWFNAPDVGDRLVAASDLLVAGSGEVVDFNNAHRRRGRIAYR